MSEALNILVVEDDEFVREAVCMTLQCAGHYVTGVNGGPAALMGLENSSFNLVITDLRMDPMDGLELLSRIRVQWPQLPVLMMTAFGDVDKAVAAMRAGACDFLMKPFEPEVLLEHVHRYAKPLPVGSMVAEDTLTKNVLQMAAKVAETDATVLLTGESGTGKEVFASFVHQNSPRKNHPFIAINCAAIPENLLEATLFGFEKGAFTGATTAQPGKFEQAQDGTILLDEISEMPLTLQAKLLRVLQEREVERVGGRKAIPLNIRVIATSNRDMLKEAQAGRFREDLYYRLNVFPLQIPALRERPADIVPLARFFLLRHSERLRCSAELGADAEAILAVHSWPGNVRELENAVQRAMILANGGVINADIIRVCLPNFAPRAEVPVPVAPVVSAEPIVVPGGLGAMPVNPAAFFVRPPQPQDFAADAVNNTAGSPSAAAAMPTNMRDLEKQHILDTLRSVGGSRKLAVEKLGISERTLRYKLQQYRQEGEDV